jgi:hypothetical protein
MGGAFSTESSERGTANKCTSALICWAAGEDTNSHEFALISEAEFTGVDGVNGEALLNHRWTRIDTDGRRIFYRKQRKEVPLINANELESTPMSESHPDAL